MERVGEREREIEREEERERRRDRECVFIHMCIYKGGGRTIQHDTLHFKCHVISISNLNLLGLFLTERCKRDLEN